MKYIEKKMTISKNLKPLFSEYCPIYHRVFDSSREKYLSNILTSIDIAASSFSASSGLDYEEPQFLLPFENSRSLKTNSP